MADIGSYFPSKWIRAADLAGRRVTVRMSHVKVEEIGQGDKKQRKPVLYFQGTDKGLVLNVTNANAIKDITGSGETDDWRGKVIALVVAKVDFQGKRSDAVRVEAPSVTPPTPLGPRQAPPVVAPPMTPIGDLADTFGEEREPGDDDDDLPF